MQFKSISLVNFKNYESLSLDFHSRVNFFTGKNGSGKTNLLDAIHYLAFCKSYFNSIDSQNILTGESFFVVQSKAQEASEEEVDLYCGIKKGQKKVFKKDKKEYDRLSDHIGLVPLVIASPSDIELIYEGSEIRRRFMDSLIAQFSKEYLGCLISYNRALQQRNSLLKQFANNNWFEAESLGIWNEKLIELGTQLFSHRQQFLDEYVPLFQKNYETIAGGSEEVSLDYKSQLTKSSFKDILDKSLEKDRRYEYTSSGVHRDDLVFFLKEQPLKKFASQGQQKSFLLALKIAQHQFLSQKVGKEPILMLDDIYDKLDDNRVESLLTLVNSVNFGQLFITDTHPNRLSGLFKQKNISYKQFSMVNGKVESENEF